MSLSENNLPTGIRIIRESKECERVWKQLYPRETLFDLWEVRDAFARSYDRELYFIVHETEPYGTHCTDTEKNRLENRCINGLLPLAWIPENRCFGFFSGETWQGRTWLEQNKIIAPDQKILVRLLQAVPGAAELRYLSPGQPVLPRRKPVHPENTTNLPDSETEDSLAASALPWQEPARTDPVLEPDETGYLFYPELHIEKGRRYERYLATFTGKSRKKLLAGINLFGTRHLAFRYNDPADLKHLFRLNNAQFQEKGYFHDPRFRHAFERLARTLQQQKRLRVVTVLVDNTIAAVDMAGVWNGTATFLAGGTDSAFPGISRLINLHHIQWACAHTDGLCTMPPEEIKCLDFLCGDFGWKERLHLTARPLFKIDFPGAWEFRPVSARTKTNNKSTGFSPVGRGNTT